MSLAAKRFASKSNWRTPPSLRLTSPLKKRGGFFHPYFISAVSFGAFLASRKAHNIH
jgi:hypothetical protein